LEEQNIPSLEHSPTTIILVDNIHPPLPVSNHNQDQPLPLSLPLPLPSSSLFSNGNDNDNINLFNNNAQQEQEHHHQQQSEPPQPLQQSLQHQATISLGTSHSILNDDLPDHEDFVPWEPRKRSRIQTDQEDDSKKIHIQNKNEDQEEPERDETNDEVNICFKITELHLRWKKEKKNLITIVFLNG